MGEARRLFGKKHEWVQAQPFSIWSIMAFAGAPLRIDLRDWLVMFPMVGVISQKATSP